MKLKKFLFTCLVLPFALTCAAEPATSIDDLLVEADHVRATSPTDFSEKLNQLSTRSQEFTPAQKSYYDYLTAYQLSITGKFDEALELYKQIHKANADKNSAFRALGSIINTHGIHRNYYEGLKALEEYAVKINDIDDQTVVNNGHIIIAAFYNQIDEYDNANYYTKLVLDNNPTPRQECISRNLIIETYIKTDKQVDRQFVDDSINKCKEINDLITAGFISLHKARILKANNEVTEAINFLSAQHDSIASLPYTRLTSDFYATLAELYFDSGNYALSKETALIAFEQSSTLNNTPPFVSSTHILSQIYRNEKDFERAYIYHQLFSEADKANLDNSLNKALAVQRVDTEILEKESQISLLDKENAVLRLQADLAKEQAQNNRLGLALTCVLLAILVVWVYRSRKVQIKLRTLAHIDSLTKINNRSFFTECAGVKLGSLEQSKKPASLVLFDLDHFKNVNDEFGHQVGDWALINAVKAAKGICRRDDIIGRMGGEEFAILLPNCTSEKAQEIAEMCRKSIESIDTSFSGHHFKITASFGVTDSDKCGYSFDKLFACADKALYSSKNLGRNRVYTFSGPLPSIDGCTPKPV